MSVKFQATAASKQVVKRLEQAGFETVFVGGAVRDALLGKIAHDIDIATAALPHEVQSLFSHTIPVGIEHGTVLVRYGGESIEVTTFRTETTYTDHRRPDEVQFVRSLREDLQRRDFTINALAIRLTGEVVDYFDGRQALHDKKIEAVGEATKRFEEDALRMIRALRFQSTLGFTIEEHTLVALKEHHQALTFVAVERIKVEMDKLFAGPGLASTIKTFYEVGFHQVLPAWPSTPPTLYFKHPVYEGGWALLSLVGGKSAKELATAYRLSKKERQLIEEVQLLQREWQGELTPWFVYCFSVAALATNAYHQEVGHQSWLEWVQYFTRKKKELPLKETAELAVTGTDFLKWSNKRPGPWLSEVIREIERLVVEGQIQNTSDHIKEWFCDNAS